MSLFFPSNNSNKYRLKRSFKKDIEPEEVFLDSPLEDAPRLKYLHAQRYFIALGRILILLLVVLIVRVGWLQIAKGDYYREIAQANRIRTCPIRADRGIIYDRNGVPLVRNIPAFDLVIIPSKLPKDEIHLRILTNIISSVIGQQREEIERIIKEADHSTSDPILIKRNLDRQKALILKTKTVGFEGVRVEINAMRDYFDGAIFSHIIGYTGKINEQELRDYPSYNLTDYIGKVGIEKTYEKTLRGNYGSEEFEIDSLGRIQRVINKKEAEPGLNLVLSIDSALQNKLYEILEKQLRALKVKGAAGIAVDPRDGKILALVSLPSFDNNLFAEGISEEDFKALLNDPAHPFLNRVISSQYPPGSTIKPIIASAALEENIINSSKKINCQGRLVIPNPYWPNKPSVFSDWKVHGPTNITKAIAESCNVFFYTVGGGFGKIKGLGIERIKKYFHLFGLGETLGIDLTGETSGLVPDIEWKKKNKPGEPWRLGDTYNTSIGQGDTTVTPLQIAMATAVVANGGTLFQPQIVDKIINSEKELVKDIEPKIIRKDFIDPKNLQVVQKGMREAVIYGSSRRMFNLPVEVAGKTGTAQFGKNKETHAWFTCYAPYESPEIVLTILVEGGGEGHAGALPVAKEVLKWYFSNRN